MCSRGARAIAGRGAKSEPLWVAAQFDHTTSDDALRDRFLGADG